MYIHTRWVEMGTTRCLHMGDKVTAVVCSGRKQHLLAKGHDEPMAAKADKPLLEIA